MGLEIKPEFEKFSFERRAFSAMLRAGRALFVRTFFPPRAGGRILDSIHFAERPTHD